MQGIADLHYTPDAVAAGGGWTIVVVAEDKAGSEGHSRTCEALRYAFVIRIGRHMGLDPRKDGLLVCGPDEFYKRHALASKLPLLNGANHFAGRAVRLLPKDLQDRVSLCGPHEARRIVNEFVPDREEELDVCQEADITAGGHGRKRRRTMPEED